MSMLQLELTVKQAVELLKQMPLKAKYAVLHTFNAESEVSWQKTLKEGEEQMRHLSADRGLDWDNMSEKERDGFVDDLLSED